MPLSPPMEISLPVPLPPSTRSSSSSFLPLMIDGRIAGAAAGLAGETATLLSSSVRSWSNVMSRSSNCETFEPASPFFASAGCLGPARSMPLSMQIEIAVAGLALGEFHVAVREMDVALGGRTVLVGPDHRAGHSGVGLAQLDLAGQHVVAVILVAAVAALRGHAFDVLGLELPVGPVACIRRVPGGGPSR